MGNKTFLSGDILTASDVNTYLMNQVIIVCTSATRPSSPNEGMTIYETDSKLEYRYNGAAWYLSGGHVPWTVVSAFTNSWVWLGSREQPSYRLEPNGVVRIRGHLKDGTIGQSAFSLPAGYRPPADLIFAVVDGANSIGRLDIGASGVVQPTIGSNVAFSINVSFSVDA